AGATHRVLVRAAAFRVLRLAGNI
ncbi:MAG: hypothetical protein QOG32_51, partial [Chloroflexota bacterium]|nr:hypothetical protein [Chloroflexota bacterium]